MRIAIVNNPTAVMAVGLMVVAVAIGAMRDDSVSPAQARADAPFDEAFGPPTEFRAGAPVVWDAGEVWTSSAEFERALVAARAPAPIVADDLTQTNAAAPLMVSDVGEVWASAAEREQAVAAAQTPAPIVYADPTLYLASLGERDALYGPPLPQFTADQLVEASVSAPVAQAVAANPHADFEGVDAFIAAQARADRLRTQPWEFAGMVAASTRIDRSPASEFVGAPMPLSPSDLSNDFAGVEPYFAAAPVTESATFDIEWPETGETRSAQLSLEHRVLLD